MRGDVGILTGDRIDDDGEWTGAAVATCVDDGVMQVVGDKPNHHRERRQARPAARGRGEAQRPLASPM